MPGQQALFHFASFFTCYITLFYFILFYITLFYFILFYGCPVRGPLPFCVLHVFVCVS
jgi:hypothetical protein